MAGLFGAANVVVAYFSTQQHWLSANDRRFLLANLLGAALILLSLYVQWNFPSAASMPRTSESRFTGSKLRSTPIPRLRSELQRS